MLFPLKRPGILWSSVYKVYLFNDSMKHLFYCQIFFIVFENRIRLHFILFEFLHSFIGPLLELL